MSVAELATNVVWTSFFNRAFELAEAAYAGGLITQEDLDSQEAYLFLGINALTALEAIAAGGEEGTIALAVGRTLSARNCPAEGRPFLDGLLRARTAYEGLLGGADEAERQRRHAALQRWVLYGSEMAERRGLLPPELEAVQVQRLCGGLHSIATQVSQREEYRLHFSTVLEILGAIEAPCGAGGLFGAAAPRGPPPEPPQVSDSVLQLYQVIFSRSFDLGEQAVQSGSLTPEEIRAHPDWLRLGLPSLVLLTCALRSSALPAGHVQLSTGEVMSAASCPPEAAPLVQALLDVRSTMEQGSALTQARCDAVGRCILRWRQDTSCAGLLEEDARKVRAASEVLFGLAARMLQFDRSEALMSETLGLLAACHAG